MATPRKTKPAAKTPPPAKKPPAPPKPALPAALAKRAKAQHAAKLARLVTVGRDAISRIRERQADVAANMVDIGLALKELKGKGVADALGRTGFANICERDLRMAVTTANALIAIATRVPREVVTQLGTDRARAVLELVDATPEDDTPVQVLRTPLKLPSGRMLDVKSASAVEIRAAAKEIRDARPDAETKRSRGFSASPADKKTFAALSKRLQQHHTASSAQLLAVKGAKGAKVRFEVPLADVAAFSAALGKALKG